MKAKSTGIRQAKLSKPRRPAPRRANVAPASLRLARKKHILITAGPTREYFDSVRFISNPSSGKMGFAIARAAAERGHRVTLVAGPVTLEDPPGVETIRVETGDEMYRASRRAFQSADAAIFTAAVCDYRPLNRSRRKQPKNGAITTIRLAPTTDIAATLGRIKRRRVTVAFALEDHRARAHAEAKLRKKHGDAIILNGPGNVGSDRAVVEFLPRGGAWETWPSMSKARLAAKIVVRLERLIEAGSGVRSPRATHAR